MWTPYLERGPLTVDVPTSTSHLDLHRSHVRSGRFQFPSLCYSGTPGLTTTKGASQSPTTVTGRPVVGPLSLPPELSCLSVPFPTLGSRLPARRPNRCDEEGFQGTRSRRPTRTHEGLRQRVGHWCVVSVPSTRTEGPSFGERVGTFSLRYSERGDESPAVGVADGTR